MAKILFFLFASLIALSFSFPNEFTFFSGYNYTSNSLLVRNKIPDLSVVSPSVTLNHKSFCYRGYWRSYTGKNYVGNQAGGFGNLDQRFCFNQTLYNGSVRYLGPADTAIQSISLYNETYLRGPELTIVEVRYGNISFTPSSLFTTARSNWTLYSGRNFNGTALCFRSNSNFHNLETLNATLAANIKSVAKGCIGKIDGFVNSYQLTDYEF